MTAMGIVAHEVGHALQDTEGYRLMRVRTAMARRLAQMAAVSPLIFIWGMWYGNRAVMALGAVMLAGMALFALVTLPVERNASLRAVAMLDRAGLAPPGPPGWVRRVTVPRTSRVSVGAVAAEPVILRNLVRA